jgi:hypothetical protein
VQCNSTHFCAGGQCVADLPFSAPCVAGCMCQSNTCGAPFFGCLP